MILVCVIPRKEAREKVSKLWLPGALLRLPPPREADNLLGWGECSGLGQGQQGRQHGIDYPADKLKCTLRTPVARAYQEARLLVVKASGKKVDIFVILIPLYCSLQDHWTPHSARSSQPAR